MTAALVLIAVSVLLGASRTLAGATPREFLAAARDRGVIWCALLFLGGAGLFLALLLACASRTAAALAVHVLIGAYIVLTAIGAHVVALADSPRAIGA